MRDGTRLLRTAFMAGAITDGAAMIPMLARRAAGVMWGLEDLDGKYSFAMGYGASLMAGWTGLLAWAFRKPGERRFVAMLTLQVIFGLVFAELLAVRNGVIEARRMLPTWIIQAIMSGLFGAAYARSRTPASDPK